MLELEGLYLTRTIITAKEKLVKYSFIQKLQSTKNLLQYITKIKSGSGVNFTKHPFYRRMGHDLPNLRKDQNCKESTNKKTKCLILKNFWWKKIKPN